MSQGGQDEKACWRGCAGAGQQADRNVLDEAEAAWGTLQLVLGDAHDNEIDFAREAEQVIDLRFGGHV